MSTFGFFNNYRVNLGTIKKVQNVLDAPEINKPISNTIVAELLEQLEAQDYVCSRLDGPTFVLVLGILLEAEYSSQQERCLVLIAVRYLESQVV